MFGARLCLLVAVACSLLRSSSAQLTGQVYSPGNVYIVTVSITNPTKDIISVLAWNNVFDYTTQLPILFDIKDDQGNVVPVASTYAMRAGMSSSDLYPLQAGQTYTRTVDLRQILQDLPSGPSKPSGAGLAAKLFTMSLPASFKGIVGDASSVIEALAALDANPPRMGDLSNSNIKDITIGSTPTRLSAVFPILGDLNPSFKSTGDGMHVANDCTAGDLTETTNALLDAGIYANSLSMAANDSSNTLFSTFFPDAARQTIGSIAAAAANSVQGRGPHVDLFCSDVQQVCGDPNMLGYSFTPSFLGNAYIVLCPSARSLGRAPQPCHTGSFYATSSHILIHLLVTLNNVVTTVMTESVNGPGACQALSKTPSALVDPTKNPDSMAQLAIAHWAYGLGGEPYNRPSCLPVGGLKRDLQRRSLAIGQRQPFTPRQPQAEKLQARDPEDFWTQIGLTQDCAASEESMLQIAAANARTLANFAIKDIGSSKAESRSRWTTYFNGDNYVKNQVRKNFAKVAKWNLTQPYVDNVAYKCDPTRRSRFCRGMNHGGTIRVLPLTTDRSEAFSLVIVCPEFFYHAISLECLNPANIPLTLNDLASDQGSWMLHELLHVVTRIPGTSDTQILDGSPQCYSYGCATQRARDRALPGAPAANLPENVATNYQYLALSARASRSDCSWLEYAGHLWGSIVATNWVAAGQIAG